jgi:hydrogenase-4 component F
VGLLLLLLALPLLTAGLGLLKGPRALREVGLVGGLLATFLAALGVARAFLAGRPINAFGGALRVDGLSALVLLLTALVGVFSGLYCVAYLRRNEARGLVPDRARRKLHALLPAYVFSLLLVCLSNDLGILWIAVELTTLASVFLVAFHNRDTSLEAAWKFLILGGLGLAFALLGTVLLYAAAGGAGGQGEPSLQWTRLMAMAPSLHPFTLKLAVVFALIGYGTKAGLAPMHTWKPDAYREAPSPAGVLMAVGMLNCALYAVIRIHLIASAALGPGFSSSLLLGFGLLSVVVSVPFILVQWNLKRLLAYSSVEHAGIMAVGLGLGGELGAFGALLHMTYHALAKPVAFFAAGTLAQLHRSSNIEAIGGRATAGMGRSSDIEAIGGGALSRTPVSASLLLLAAVMVTGCPPFALFFSEMMILRSGFLGPHRLSAVVFLASLVLLFCGFFYQVGRVALGPAGVRRDGMIEPEVLDLGTATAGLAALLALVSAFYLPRPLLDLIHAAAGVVMGRP